MRGPAEREKEKEITNKLRAVRKAKDRCAHHSEIGQERQNPNLFPPGRVPDGAQKLSSKELRNRAKERGCSFG